MMLLRQLSYAIMNQLVGGTERSYYRRPYAIKNQRGSRMILISDLITAVHHSITHHTHTPASRQPTLFPSFSLLVKCLGGGRQYLALGPGPRLKTDSALTNPTSCEQSRQIREDFTQKIQQRWREHSNKELNE